MGSVGSVSEFVIFILFYSENYDQIFMYYWLYLISKYQK